MYILPAYPSLGESTNSIRNRILVKREWERECAYDLAEVLIGLTGTFVGAYAGGVLAALMGM